MEWYSDYVDPRVRKTLQKLGYSVIRIKYRKIHAKRNRDHLIIKVNKKGMPRTDKPGLISAHQDFPSKIPPYHRASFDKKERLIKEFERAWMKEMASSGDSLENNSDY